MTAPVEVMFRRRWVFWAAYFSFWTFIGLFQYCQSIVGRLTADDPTPFWQIDFAALLLYGVADWYLWAALGPFLIRLARRFPLDRPGWPVSLLVHLAANVLCMVLIVSAMVPLNRWVNSRQGRELSPYGAQYRHALIYEFVPYSWVYWSIIGLTHAMDYYRKYREREWKASQLEFELAQAQLQVLKMQLQPHFLFNTLNAIAALVQTDARLATRMIARLGEMLRFTLQNAGQQEVPLRQELDLVRAYLEIEQARLGPRLRLTMDIAPETLDALVPNLSWQPLVENAVRHAITPRPQGGRVELSARREGGRLRLEVRDDGPGFGTQPVPGRGTGMGLAATCRRLQHLYGDAHRFEVSDRPGGGAVVSVVLPFREHDPLADDSASGIAEPAVNTGAASRVP